MRAKPAPVYALCEVQPGVPGGWEPIHAFEIPGGLALRSEEDDLSQVDAQPRAYLELSHAGWQTLVEMYALRHPDAFQRLAQKVETLRHLLEQRRTQEGV